MFTVFTLEMCSKRYFLVTEIYVWRDFFVVVRTLCEMVDEAINEAEKETEENNEMEIDTKKEIFIWLYSQYFFLCYRTSFVSPVEKLRS